MEQYNILRALADKKRTYKVSREGKETRLVLGRSINQVRAKFKKWQVQEVILSEYLKNKLELE
ncbi:MAG: hypothetical protein WA061_02810 [Microgenomates group bacterium]